MKITDVMSRNIWSLVGDGEYACLSVSVGMSLGRVFFVPSVRHLTFFCTMGAAFCLNSRA